MTPARLWWVAVPLVALLAPVPRACAGAPGPLRADTRVKILEPKPGSTVTGPVVIRWSITFDPGEAAGLWFAVSGGPAAVPPGQSILNAAAEPCDTVPACLALGAIDG